MNDKNKILFTVSIYHAFNDGSVAVIPILFPVFKTLFDLSYTQVGVITGGGLLITLITQILIGRISDRKDRRLILSIGVLLLSVSLLLLTGVQGFLTLLLFILLLRFSAGFFHPIGIGWISKTFKKDRLDWAMGIQSALGDFGGFIALLTTLSIVEIKDWSYPFYLWSIAGIICLLLGLYLTRNTPQENLKNNNLEKKQPKASFSGEWDVLRNLKIFLPGVIISGSAWGIIITYAPLLLNERTTLSLSAIGVVISIWLGVGTLICFLYGKIQSIMGRRNTLIFAYLTMGVMVFALTVFTNVIILILIMILLGVSTFMTYPAMFSFVSELTDETIEGKTFGYIFTFQLGGGTILLFLGGVTADIWGIWTPFIILGLLCFLVAIELVFNYNKLRFSG